MLAESKGNAADYEKLDKEQLLDIIAQLSEVTA